MITARGDLFDVPVEDGSVKNMFHTSGVHEREASYSSDGKNIAFISDDQEIVQKFNFGQPREKVINKTVSKSLEILRKEIL